MVFSSSCDKAQSSFHLRVELRESFPFDEKAGQRGDLPKDVMAFEGRSQVILAGTASRADACADRPMDHTHMAIAPGTELFVYFQ